MIIGTQLFVAGFLGEPIVMPELDVLHYGQLDARLLLRVGVHNRTPVTECHRTWQI